MPFPTELYKDEYYRLAHSEEELATLKGDGWVANRPANHQYKPWSSHPSQTAAKHVSDIPPVKPVHAPEPPPAPPEDDAPKRGPGRPPNPKPAE